jgi:D-xylose transport system substrate-binding protein
MNLKTALMVVSLMISIVIGVVLARGGSDGGGAAKGGKGGPLIGLSLDTEKEPRWQADRDLFKAKCMELGARDVRVLSAQGDDTTQVSNVNTLLTGQCDVIVIVSHNGEAMAEGVRAAHAAGIPVIAYDRLIMNCDLDLYLSFDNVKVGRLQAQYLIDHLPNHKGNIVRVNGAPTDNNAKLFKQGQDEVLKPYIDRGDVKIIHEDWAEDWRPDNAKKIVDAAITRNGRDSFQAVLAAADGIAGGAHQVLVENGLAGKVILTGQDADLISCQRIVAGTQSMTVYKPLKQLATRAAEVAIKMASGKPVIANQTVNNNKIDVPSVLGDIYAVDKLNIDQTVIKDGFQSREAVYGGAK